MAAEGYHEPLDSLTPEVMDVHRAIRSLQEELEAVDWYNQRAAATGDDTLRAILEHNRDDEKEHAAMILEWLRRHDPQLDEQLHKYLFQSGDITALEHAGDDAAPVAGKSRRGKSEEGTAPMNHLLREKAPITDAAWAAIEEEATRTLKHFLTARRLVEVNVLGDWTAESVPSGRVAKLSEAPAGIKARIRAVQPLVEYKAKFTLDRRGLSAIDRGARDANLDAVRDAARHLALAEDGAVFIGNESAAITGITHASTNEKLPIGDNYSEYPRVVARAVALLQTIGVAGPYAVALGPRCFTGVVETTEMGGYPVLEHLRLIAGGPVLWAPAVDGAVVLSTRGGDYELTVGEDAAIGYTDHDDDTVDLYFEESFTFQVLTPEAAVHLVYT